MHLFHNLPIFCSIMLSFRISLTAGESLHFYLAPQNEALLQYFRALFTVLPSRSLGSSFYVVPSAHFIIVEFCWRICSKSRFDLSLAFWLWASVISHFPRRQAQSQICMQACSQDQYLQGTESAGLGRWRSWIAFQWPRKLQLISGTLEPGWPCRLVLNWG